jgi:hypothetical protein
MSLTTTKERQMPNWCENDGTIQHKDVKKIKALYNAIEEGKFCEHILPLPNGKWDYDWCVENWDTKWELDFGDYELEDENTIRFSALSAWSPPDNIYRKLISLGFEIDIDYFEGGMDFCGVVTNKKKRHIDSVYEKYKNEELPMWALKRWDFDSLYDFEKDNVVEV